MNNDALTALNGGMTLQIKISDHWVCDHLVDDNTGMAIATPITNPVAQV